MSRRLLIVDDNNEFRTMLKSYLVTEDLNIQIYEASSAEMAVTKASCVKPHIVLMDINLPQANGLCATKEILQDHPDCHLIILTMFEVDTFKEAAKEVKAKEFIPKSEIYEKLVPTLKRSLSEMQV